jgi:S-adenosylmethionine:tRNA ribosyltransferase-isomerase
MKKSDFHFELPPELIAQQPLAERSASRLLVVPPAPAAFEDHAIRELPQMLRAGDLLVFNDTRVVPARLYGAKETGGRVEILLERITGTSEVRAQIGASKSPKANSRIVLDDGTELTVLGRDDEFYRLRFETDEPLDKVLQRAGHMPLPPYIHREADISDDERYQTVFARHTGAVAAPTPGLHFDE